MRILHLTTFLQGGAGRAITELALAQRAAGDDVAIAIDEHHEPGYESYAEYLARLEAGGIRPLERLHRFASFTPLSLPSAASTADGFIGSSRTRTPMALYTALAMAAAVGMLAGSPMPWMSVALRPMY